MRWAGHEARMEERKGVYRETWGNETIWNIQALMGR